MSTDIDPAFVDRCAATAIGLRQLAELGAHPDADDGAVELAARVTAELLTDPEALLAVALVIEQRRADAVTLMTSPAWRPVSGAAQPVPALRRFSQVNDLDTSTRYCPCGASITWSGCDPALDAWLAKHRPHVDTDAVDSTTSADGARVYAAAGPRDDDLRTLRPGETRLVGGRMWARCKSCSFVGPLEGRGTWHVCDPVSAPMLGGQAP